MKFAAGMLTSLLVFAPQPEVTVQHETFVRERTVMVEPTPLPPPPPVEPLDEAEFDRQADCLWRILQDEGVPIEFEIVMAASTWFDAIGGACATLGE